MRMLKKKNQLQQYANTVFININTSKFYYQDPRDILQIKKLQVHISKLRPNLTHYLYMFFLLYPQRPHINKFYMPHKFRYQKNRVRRRHVIMAILNKKNSYKFISKLLLEILPFSSSTEKEGIKKTQDCWKLTIWQAPLTNETYHLQSSHGYISNIPLTISFHFTNLSKYQHLHFFSFFKIINYETLLSLST